MDLLEGGTSFFSNLSLHFKKYLLKCVITLSGENKVGNTKKKQLFHYMDAIYIYGYGSLVLNASSNIFVAMY